MEKEFAPYELAVKLKELGFDEPCFGLWNINNGKYEVDIIGICKYSKDFKYRKVLAPTFSASFRWFREKYGICNWIERLYTENSVAYYKTTQEYKKDASSKIHNVRVSLKNYTTYEEAELACLEKLIEIVNQNKEDE